MKSTRGPKSFYLLAAALAAVSTGHASLIFGNLPGSGTYTGTEQSLSASNEMAVGVTTGNTTLQFDFLEGYFASVSGGTLSGGIYTNGSGAPGTEIGVFGSETVASGDVPALTTFYTTSAVNLVANTEYWFVVDPPVQLGWAADSSNGMDGTVPTGQNGSGYTSDGYDRSTNGGTSWTSSNTASLTVEIDAAPIPEPGSLTMFACGCALFFARRLTRGKATDPGAPGIRCI